jgi:hypothetical protein
MEDGDDDALKNWRVWRELSVKKYAEEYERLNVHFDVYTGESKVGKRWQDYALERLTEMGLISDVEGAKLVDLEKWKLGKAVLRKKGALVPLVSFFFSASHDENGTDGTSIYLTRDIGGAIERYEQHKFDKMIYVISSQQDLHTAQFIKMLHLMEFPWASGIEHVNYGLVLGMSTRKGTVVFLEQIIREAASVMHEQMKKNQEKYAAVEDPEQTSLEVGLAAIKIQDMAAKRYANLSHLVLTNKLTFRIILKNKQLQLQLGPDDVLRRRHGPILAIRARAAFLAYAQKSRAATASSARADRGRDAGGTACCAGDRVFAGDVPGRGPDGVADARAERSRHVRVSARACDFERVGDRRCQGRGGRRACAREDVALCLCEGRAWGCDAVAEHSTVGANVRVSEVLVYKMQAMKRRDNRPLLINTTMKSISTREEPLSSNRCLFDRDQVHRPTPAAAAITQ